MESREAGATLEVNDLCGRRFGAGTPAAAAVIFAAALLLCRSGANAQDRINGATTAGTQIAVQCIASATPSGGSRDHDYRDYMVPSGAMVAVEFAPSLKPSRVHPGIRLEGKLLHPLYAGEQEAVPAGATVDIVVRSVAKQSSTGNKFVKSVRAFYHLLHGGKPASYEVSIESAELILAEGAVPVRLGFLQMGERREVLPKKKAQGPRTPATPATSTPVPAPHAKSNRRSEILLELQEPLTLRQRSAGDSGIKQTPAGVGASRQGGALHTRLYLLNRLSASKNKVGDTFQARLAEPLRLENELLPEGSIFQGRVTKRVPPRRLSRPGLLHLEFDKVVLPGGGERMLRGSLSRAEVSLGTKLNMDGEGTLRPQPPGARAVITEIGETYLVGKIADDSAEGALHLAASTLASHSVTLTARYFGAGAEAAFVLLQHGKDVQIPQYSELEVDLSRPSGPALP